MERPLRFTDSQRRVSDNQEDNPHDAQHSTQSVSKPANSWPVRDPVKSLPDADWQLAFQPTMDNPWGDDRLPVTVHNRPVTLLR